MPLTKEEKKDIGQRILSIWRNSGLSKDEFAQLHGLKSGHNIDNYAQGKSEPDGSFYQSLANSGIDLNYVIAGKEQQATVSSNNSIENRLHTVEKALKRIAEKSKDKELQAIIDSLLG